MKLLHKLRNIKGGDWLILLWPDPAGGDLDRSAGRNSFFVVAKGNRLASYQTVIFTCFRLRDSISCPGCFSTVSW